MIRLYLMADFNASWLPIYPESGICHFNSTDYFVYLQFSKKISFSYSLKNKTIYIVFAQTNEFEWTSLPSSTFGGFDINHAVSGDTLIKFIERIEEWFIQNTDARFLKVNLPPNGSGYSCPDYQFYFLYSQNYLINSCNLSYSIKIQELNFDRLLSRGNLKRINKCVKNNFYASEVSLNELSSVYEVIANNRKFKGYPITLSFDSLKDQSTLFSEKFKLFSVEKNGMMVAAAVTIMLTPGTLYVLYWGDIPEFRSYSPIVLLCRAIYSYCQRNNLQYLDVGTSTIDKEPNFGLMDFKVDLGFKPNLKFSMQKAIRCEI